MRIMIKSLAAAVVIAAGTAMSAQSATLDFIAEAAGNERGVVDGTTITFDGLDVEFNSSHFAYFDDLSGGKPAGLGVCKVLTGSDQCSPSNDDNITAGESVTLSFKGLAVDFMATSFFDADHNSLAGSLDTLLIGVNGGPTASFSFADALTTTFSGIKSITFAFGGTDSDQFYVGGATASKVPLPAGLPLLIGGLGILGFARRFKKT